MVADFLIICELTWSTLIKIFTLKMNFFNFFFLKFSREDKLDLVAAKCSFSLMNVCRKIFLFLSHAFSHTPLHFMSLHCTYDDKEKFSLTWKFEFGACCFVRTLSIGWLRVCDVNWLWNTIDALTHSWVCEDYRAYTRLNEKRENFHSEKIFHRMKNTKKKKKFFRAHESLKSIFYSRPWGSTLCLTQRKVNFLMSEKLRNWFSYPIIWLHNFFRS